MEKSIHSKRYERFLELLKEVRAERGFTQMELAEAVGETQSFVSKCERGERRLDVVELATFCKVLGVSLEEFAARLTKALRKK